MSKFVVIYNKYFLLGDTFSKPFLAVKKSWYICTNVGEEAKPLTSHQGGTFLHFSMKVCQCRPLVVWDKLNFLSMLEDGDIFRWANYHIKHPLWSFLSVCPRKEHHVKVQHVMERVNKFKWMEYRAHYYSWTMDHGPVIKHNVFVKE